MEHITIPNIEKEMQRILEGKTMCYSTLADFVMLGQAMEYMKFARREFTEEDAKHWVAHMDPPARWTLEQTTAVMQQYGYNHKPYEFFAVMNMLNSDMGKTMAKYGADRAEVWAALAHDWLSDPDAEPDKPGRYWRDIVLHKK